MYYPYKVIVYLKSSSGTTTLQGFGETPDNSNFIYTAKRLIEEYTGKRPGHIKSLSTQERIPVSSVSENISKDWPDGIKTIPVYFFEYSI